MSTPVPCICGADLSDAPVKATWIMAGGAAEMRDCIACRSSRTFSLYEQIGRGRVGAWETLFDAINDLVLPTDDWRDFAATLPPGATLSTAGIIVARVLPNGLWFVLPPV